MDRDINFPDGGANILPESAAFSTQFAAPANNAVYAKASRDLNPIHTNPYFADLADLVRFFGPLLCVANWLAAFHDHAWHVDVCCYAQACGGVCRG